MPRLKFDIEQAMQFDDAREIPAYTVAEAAHYLRIPVSTLRTWVKGRKYPVQPGQEREFAPVIELADQERGLLSFYNLAEAHVLRPLRSTRGVRLHNVREALDFVQQRTDWDHPLIHEEFETVGLKDFVEQLGKSIEDSDRNQLVFADMKKHLGRFDWQQRVAARLYPFTRIAWKASDPRVVVIDPTRAFGKPILDRVGVETEKIAQRYKAGESIDALVKDYDASQTDIEEAIRCELQIGVAA